MLHAVAGVLEFALLYAVMEVEAAAAVVQSELSALAVLAVVAELYFG